MEVAVLRPVPSFSAVLAGVGGGFGLPSHIYVYRDRIAWGQIGVGKACGRSSLIRSEYHWEAACGGGRDMGLLVGGVEGLVRCAILVHSDGKAEPSFGIRVWGPSICYSCEGHRDSTVEASAELHHYRL